MNRLNEPIMNQIEVSTTVFNKIYRFTEIHYGNISKSFIYITVEVENYENENDNFDTEDADAHLLKMTDSHHSIASKNIKNIKKGKKKKIIKIPSQEQEHLNKYNHDSSDCNHDPNNPIKPKPLLNINKIKNIVSNDKKDARKKVKIVPIEKKINTIMEKITSKLQSEIMKEYMNYNLILENSKKSKKQNGSYINHIKAIYHVLLNKIDSKL